MSVKYPYWLGIAKRYRNLREVKGPKHSSVITGWLDTLNAWWRDDETPWCGVFVAAVMKEARFEYPKMYMRAKAWLDWGQKISRPVYGCIGVFDRAGGGHVGFIVGETPNGHWLAVYGGNQSDSVNTMLIERSRLIGCRLPPGYSFSNVLALPMASTDELRKSFDEA